MCFHPAIATSFYQAYRCTVLAGVEGMIWQASAIIKHFVTGA